MENNVKKPFYKKAWFWIVVVILVVILAGGGNDETVPSTSTTNVSTENKITEQPKVKEPVVEDNIYNLNETLTSNKCSLTMTKFENNWTGYNQYLGPDAGNKIVRAYFTFDNGSSNDKTIGSYAFDCYADGASCERYIFANQSKDFTSLVTISAGRKAEGWVYFQVPKNADVIEFEYETNLWNDNKAIFIP